MTREEYNEHMRVYMRTRIRRRRMEAKKHLGGKCARCGSRKKLEFDHRDRKIKLHRIAKMWAWSERRFWAEVEKCQLLCFDCHNEKSLKERGFKKSKGVHGTAGNYRYGCRCDLCRKAKSKQQREYLERKRGQSIAGDAPGS
jgi:hypothetical protein